MIVDPYQAIIERLAGRGVTFHVLEHTPLFTMADVQRELDINLNMQVKAVVVSDRSNELTICGVHPTARLDMAAVAKVLETSRSGLQLAPSDIVESELGLPPGAIGLVAPLPTRVLLADSFRGESDVYFGAGRNDRTLQTPLDALVGAFALRYARIERL